MTWAAAVVTRTGPPTDATRDAVGHLSYGRSRLLTEGRGWMSWRVTDRGFRMTLSAAVPELIRTNLGGWLEGWLQDQGLGINDVGSWAVHPGGPRILGAEQDALALENGHLDVSREVLRSHGNMSSPTVLFILERLRKAGAALPCVALAFGPGLVVEAMLVA